MATEPLLAFDELLAAIPGDDPAGEAIGFSVRAEMEEARKEIDLSDFDANDPLRPTEAKKADWKSIVKAATKTLKESSKDLLVAARLTEALTKLHGYQGFHDGLLLMRRLIEECWDRLHPEIDDGDLEVRAGPFNWLGDDGRGARFPYSLRIVPLFKGVGASYNLRDWKNIQDGKAGVSRDDYERAINAATREHCQALVDDLNRAMEEMTKLLGVLNERLGKEAPGMMDVRAALSDALVLAKQALSRKAPTVSAEEPAAGEDAGKDGSASAPAQGSARVRTTRADVYARLSEAADLLERMEPHSPVPYLIRRAVDLGRMPFPEMMKALMREEFKNALVEMNRELGIKEGDASQPKQQGQSGW